MVLALMYHSRSVYGNVELFKQRSLLDNDLSGTDEDEEILQVLNAVSDWIDAYCNRTFYPWTRTLYFDGPGDQQILLPDLISITTIKEDTTKDLTYDLTWTTTDYSLYPYNADPTRQGLGQPYTSLLVSPGGKYKLFPKGVRNFEIVGTWGYSDETETLAATTNEALDATEAAIDMLSGHILAAGMTIKIDSEQIYIWETTATVLTVVRAMNGTTGATHSNGATILVQRVPRGIERAALMQATRIWSRAPSFEPYFVSPFLDPDIRLFLDPYRKLPV